MFVEFLFCFFGMEMSLIFRKYILNFMKSRIFIKQINRLTSDSLWQSIPFLWIRGIKEDIKFKPEFTWIFQNSTINWKWDILILILIFQTKNMFSLINHLFLQRLKLLNFLQRLTYTEEMLFFKVENILTNNFLCWNQYDI